MHSDLMTRKELAKLRRQVRTFFRKHEGTDIRIAKATAYFKALGLKLTRPIEHTLQAHGFVERPVKGYIWPFHLVDNAWRIKGRTLRAPETA